jgi:hypothetical protein
MIMVDVDGMRIWGEWVWNVIIKIVVSSHPQSKSALNECSHIYKTSPRVAPFNRCGMLSWIQGRSGKGDRHFRVITSLCGFMSNSIAHMPTSSKGRGFSK